MYKDVVKLEGFKKMIDSFSLEISEARKNIEVNKWKYGAKDCEILCKRNDILRERNRKLTDDVAKMIQNAKVHSAV